MSASLLERRGVVVHEVGDVLVLAFRDDKMRAFIGALLVEMEPGRRFLAVVPDDAMGENAAKVLQAAINATRSLVGDPWAEVYRCKGCGAMRRRGRRCKRCPATVECDRDAHASCSRQGGGTVRGGRTHTDCLARGHGERWRPCGCECHENDDGGAGTATRADPSGGCPTRAGATGPFVPSGKVGSSDPEAGSTPAAVTYESACTCAHVLDEHGGDPDYPGSTACNVEGCECIAFELDEGAHG